MSQSAESRTYHQIKHRLFFVGLLLDIVILGALWASGTSTAMRDLAVHLSSDPLWVNGAYILMFMAGMYLVHFPLSLFEGFTLEHKFSLSTQKFSAWLADDLKKALLGLVVGLILVEVVYAFLRISPDRWWLWAGGFYLFLTLFLARITPQVIIPIFYKYAQIEDQELRRRVVELFKSNKVAIQDAYTINFSAKTKKANAFICGLGKSRRVVLTDTLIANFTIPQIEAVVAHEIAHYKHRDILKMTAINSLVTFLGFFLIDRLLRYCLASSGLASIADIAFFPIVVLAFMVLGVVVMPLLNGYSRAIETEADRFCLRVTGRPDDFISMMRKLGEMNLSEFEPGRFTEIFFYDHPPVSKRIKFAQNFQPAV